MQINWILQLKKLWLITFTSNKKVEVSKLMTLSPFSSVPNRLFLKGSSTTDARKIILEAKELRKQMNQLNRFKLFIINQYAIFALEFLSQLSQLNYSLTKLQLSGSRINQKNKRNTHINMNYSQLFDVLSLL